MDHIGVFFLMLPATVPGFTVRNEDDSYTVFLNLGLSATAQKEAYMHEREHIDNRDYDHIYDVNYLEKIRHMVG